MKKLKERDDASTHMILILIVIGEKKNIFCACKHVYQLSGKPAMEKIEQHSCYLDVPN